ncbi:hypothetical protein GPICK_04995 [Geobacter pickeringii]|uniref:Periplasmic copper-binding protein NosD beta helix domain-containing protein n=1 Tax=Geobacter pickeringii TaxID=345632 RepID=A0A0B5B8C2_9BACT|nr:hypothetical protein GPICK_04995 [Geobacter pickeringii]
MLLITAITLLPCGMAAAGDLYVDAGHRRASDRNGGTKRTLPCRTISAAVARAGPGDTVWIAGGTYRETITLPRSGRGPRSRIRLCAAPGAEVTIKGSDPVTGWLPQGRGIWKRNGWPVNSQQLFVDGAPLSQTGATSPFNTIRRGNQPILPTRGKGAGDMAAGSFFYDVRERVLYLRLSDGSDPNRRLVEASVRDHIIPAGDASFIELRNLKFSHSNISSVPRMMGMVNVGGKSWVVAGCSFTYGDFAGLNITGEGHRIIGNVCNHNGNVGISLNGSDGAHGWRPYPGRPPQDIVLEGNETSYNNYRGFYPFFQGGGLKGANSCTGIRISRHTAVGNNGTGLWFDIFCREITVEASLVKRNLRGIEFEISDGALLAGNLITGNTLQGIYISASSGVTVENNTLTGNGYGIVVHGLPRPEHPELRNNRLRNNIIAESVTAELVIYHHPPETAGNSSDYNRYYRRGGSARISWTHTPRYDITHHTLESFSRETGLEAHSRWDGPLLPETAPTP